MNEVIEKKVWMIHWFARERRIDSVCWFLLVCCIVSEDGRMNIGGLSTGALLHSRASESGGGGGGGGGEEGGAAARGAPDDC